MHQIVVASVLLYNLLLLCIHNGLHDLEVVNVRPQSVIQRVVIQWLSTGRQFYGSGAAGLNCSAQEAYACD